MQKIHVLLSVCFWTFKKMKILIHVRYGEGPESSAIFPGEGDAPGQLTPL